MHTNSRLLFQKHAREFFRPGLRVLEIGPDKFPSTYCSLVADGSITWDTLDIWQDARLTYSATSEYSFPAPSDTYDIVLSGRVIEHVRKIWLWIKELTRVCKVGGLVITINPVSWPYHEHPIRLLACLPGGNAGPLRGCLARSTPINFRVVGGDTVPKTHSGQVIGMAAQAVAQCLPNTG